MNDKIKITTLSFLDYNEIAELKGNPTQRESLVKITKRSLLEELMEKTGNDLDFDKAFRIKIELQNNMNLVGKIEEIPINHIVLNLPEVPDFPTIEYQPVKLNFKQRIKVLLKGRL